MAKTARLKVMSKTPRELGYTFPAEWEEQAATWFSWPRPEGISFPDKYHTIPKNLVAIIRQIVPRQRVHINVVNGNWEYIVRELLTRHRVPLDNVRFHHIPTNESWCRDHGPAFVVKKRAAGGRRPTARRAGAQRTAPQLGIVDWGFNAWGGKYPPYDADDAVPTRIAEQLGLPVWYPGIIMEGGAVEFNGRGTVLTTTD